MEPVTPAELVAAQANGGHDATLTLEGGDAAGPLPSGRHAAPELPSATAAADAHRR